MSTYYVIEHRAGYGREDHLADEIIARAARRLGMATGSYVAACVGLASHAVPMHSASVRVPTGTGVRRRLEGAIRAARKEFGRYVDCVVEVATYRTEYEYTDKGRERTRVTWRREGARWVCIDRTWDSAYAEEHESQILRAANAYYW